MNLAAITFLLVSALVASGCSDGVLVSGAEATNGNTDETDIGSGSGTGNADSGGTNNGGGDSGSELSELSLTAIHRSGQTFLTWDESANSNYHVYRHTVPITSDNLDAATRLSERWGPLDQDTSVNLYATSDGPSNFVISDLSSPLSDDQGLFVHTTQNGQQGEAYYAVTTVNGATENRDISAGSNSTSQPLSESVSTPRPILSASINDGKGRLYTQYMDYANWNPTLNGYAFNFAVALPSDYDASVSYPLMVFLHAYGSSQRFVSESDWEAVIQIFPSDPGSGVNTVNTWWYGHAADHNYKTQGSIPSTGTIENFTEQRVMSAVNYIIDDGQFNVNRDLVHMVGGSMGGSGVLAFGMRYPSVFAGVYANQPMTNYATNPIFQNDFTQLWGEISTNLPIVNGGSNTTDIQNYDMNGSQPTRVWDWMNHQEQLRIRRADRFAYLMIDHGKLDAVIDWQTQGRPMPQVFADARVGFSAVALGESAHIWLNFIPVVKSVFGLGFGQERGWRYLKSLSFPGIHNASDSGPLLPANTGDDWHNTEIEWSTPSNNFHLNIVDTTNLYEITIRSTSTNQTADITPRNTNAFRPSSGMLCNWNAQGVSDNNTIDSGSAAVDGSGLLTIPQVPILIDEGTRLFISGCS